MSSLDQICPFIFPLWDGPLPSNHFLFTTVIMQMNKIITINQSIKKLVLFVVKKGFHLSSTSWLPLFEAVWMLCQPNFRVSGPPTLPLASKTSHFNKQCQWRSVIFTSSLFSGRWPWSVWCWRGSPASSSPSLATSLSSCFQSASSALASPSLTPPSSPCSGSSWTRSTPLSMAPSTPSQIYPTVQVPPSI